MDEFSIHATEVANFRKYYPKIVAKYEKVCSTFEYPTGEEVKDIRQYNLLPWSYHAMSTQWIRKAFIIRAHNGILFVSSHFDSNYPAGNDLAYVVTNQLSNCLIETWWDYFIPHEMGLYFYNICIMN